MVNGQMLIANWSCSDMAPSSSGLGHLVLIQKIAGSNPAGVTTKIAHLTVGFFRGHSLRE